SITLHYTYTPSVNIYFYLDELLNPCNRSSGCLRLLDYWDVTNSKVAYNGTLNLVIKNVGSLEICWDMCSSYIGFECLAATYNPENRECRLSDKTSESWNSVKSLLSRTRTRQITDPNTYCLEKVADNVNKSEAIRKCDDYKTGWEIPVIRDQIMMEKLSNLTNVLVMKIYFKDCKNYFN
ncbi:hypothetical protein LSH36_573g07015, partial [Paralvinella palmiformis]